MSRSRPHHHGHRFDDLDRWVERLEAPDRADWQQPDELLRRLGVRPGETVADVGAGTGYLTVRLARAVGPSGRVLARDSEPGMVRYLERRLAGTELAAVVDLRKVDDDDPDLPRAAVDRILICDTWHHVDARAAYLVRLAGALAPGGRLVVVDFHPHELPIGPPPAHKLSPEQVETELRAGGWSRIDGFDLPYQYVRVFSPPSNEGGSR